jgi:hypothetical protein
LERTVAEDAEGLVALREEEGELDLQGLEGQRAQRAQKALEDQRAIASQIPIIYGQ